MIDKQNQALARVAAYERARIQSDLGQQWRTSREENYQKLKAARGVIVPPF